MPGKSAFNETHPLSVGAGGLTTTGPAEEWLAAADVIFAVGSSLTASPYAQSFAPEAFLIHAVIDADEINKGHGGGHRDRRRREADPAGDDRGGQGAHRRIRSRTPACAREWLSRRPPGVANGTRI